MLFITERKTEQVDYQKKIVLKMVSLFVVASDEELETLLADKFVSFLIAAREKGFLVLPRNEGDVSPELIEISRTRKGFLIKASKVAELEPADFPAVLPTTLDELTAGVDIKHNSFDLGKILDEIFSPTDDHAEPPKSTH